MNFLSTLLQLGEDICLPEYKYQDCLLHPLLKITFFPFLSVEQIDFSLLCRLLHSDPVRKLLLSDSIIIIRYYTTLYWPQGSLFCQI